MLRILQRLTTSHRRVGAGVSLCYYSTKAQTIASASMQQDNIVPRSQIACPLDLASGTPPPEILEASSRFISKASENLFKHTSCCEVLDYGPNAGPQQCLDKLSHFLSRRYRTGVHADWLFTMAGASQAMHLVPSLLGPKSPGSPVFVEQPTYMHAIDIFNKDLLYSTIPVETDKDGVRPDGFRKALDASITSKMIAESSALNRFASILYVQTAFANPGGWSLPRERLSELERIAQQYNVLIVADDVYSFTNFSDSAMSSYLPSTCAGKGCNNDEPSQHVVTLGSVSKIISPGLRFGWVVASKRILSSLNESGFIQSGGCPNQYIASLVGEMIADGSADFLTDMLRKELKCRFSMTQRIFEAHLPATVRFTVPQGGFFVWLTVPNLFARFCPEANSATLVEFLQKRHGVRVVDGQRCLVSQHNQSHHDEASWGIRVSVAALPQEELANALRLLADGICDYFGFKPVV